jgi:two-component system, NarL family, response regulator NreC
MAVPQSAIIDFVESCFVYLETLGELKMGITVLLADSVVDVRQIERKLLQKEPDIEVVGEAADEPEAMMLVKSLEPQIVLTDFNVRSTGKIFAKQIKSQHPRTKILGVTELKGRYVKNFIKLFGADELLDRNHLETLLITTVRLVAKGG